MRALAAVALLALAMLGPLSARAAARAETLVEAVARGNPAALVDHMVALGLRIDLSDPAQVSAAIGDVHGLRTRRSATSGFVGYTVPAGEIIFNPDLGSRNLLLVSLHACMPARVLRDRVHGPDFMPPASRITVLTYEEAEFRSRPGTALTFPTLGACFGTLGIVQSKRGA